MLLLLGLLLVFLFAFSAFVRCLVCLLFGCHYFRGLWPGLASHYRPVPQTIIRAVVVVVVVVVIAAAAAAAAFVGAVVFLLSLSVSVSVLLLFTIDRLVVLIVDFSFLLVWFDCGH